MDLLSRKGLWRRGKTGVAVFDHGSLVLVVVEMMSFCWSRIVFLLVGHGLAVDLDLSIVDAATPPAIAVAWPLSVVELEMPNSSRFCLWLDGTKT